MNGYLNSFLGVWYQWKTYDIILALNDNYYLFYVSNALSFIETHLVLTLTYKVWLEEAEFNKHFLRTYYVSDMAPNKTNKNPCLHEAYTLVGKDIQ